MKLIVGLGNPGKKYEATRHNAGFRVLDELAKRWQLQPRPKAALKADLAEGQLNDERVLLLWPQTYMNLSGQSVQPVKDFYKLTVADLIVVCDDFNLPLGKLRMRKSGSSGGQKGLEDIIRRLGVNDFCRLRIGIGAPPPNFEVTDFVLGKFTKEEQTEIEIAIARGADAVETWIKQGADAAMAAFNG